MIFNNPFFKKRKKIYLYDILKVLNIKELKSYKNTLISDIKNLDESLKNNISFLHSARYKDDLKSSNSNYIITTNNLSKFIPNSKNQIVVKNVLTSVAKMSMVSFVVVKLFPIVEPCVEQLYLVIKGCETLL